MAETAPPPPPPPQAGRPARRKRGWILLVLRFFNAMWSLLVLSMVVAVGGVYFLYDRPVVMPAWIEARIEQRLAEDFPQVVVSLGEMRLLMEEGWRPRVRLRDVAVRTAGGDDLVRISEVRARLSMSALANGKLHPAEIALRGVFATLVRAHDGSLALRTVQGAARTARGIEPPGALVSQIDAILQRPGFAAFEAAEIRGLTLQYIDRRAQRAFTLDGGRMIAQRRDGALVVNADLALLGDGPKVTTLSANFTSQIGASEAQFGVQIANVSAVDIATQSPAFAWLGALRAPISGAVRSGVREDGTLAPLSAALQIGAGVVQPNDGSLPRTH